MKRNLSHSSRHNRIIDTGNLWRTPDAVELFADGMTWNRLPAVQYGEDEYGNQALVFEPLPKERQTKPIAYFYLS